MPAEGITITGGGSYAVATDDQLDRVQRLEAFAETARTIVLQLAALDAGLSEAELRAASAPASALLAKHELADAIPALSRAASEAAACAALTRLAMRLYGLAEHEIEKQVELRADALAQLLGHFTGPAQFVGFGAAILLMGTISPKPDSGENIAQAPWWQQVLATYPGLVNNPLTAHAISVAVDGMDDSMLTGLGVPPGVVDTLTATGLAGPELAAALLVKLGHPFGKLTESEVTVSTGKKVTRSGSAPTGWADRIARIPDATHNGGYQIRIDRFTSATGTPSFEVYLSGTQTFSTSKTTTPFDFTSDTNGLAGLPNGAVASVEKAMKAAGITSSDPVNITGHSEGGLVAHEIAASGHWNVQVSLEAGSPAAHTSVPAGTTEVALAHTEDVVPSLGGMRDGADKTIVVHASAFPDGSVPKGETVPAHDTARYEHTATVLDHASSSMITDAKDKADASEKGATGTVTTTLFKAERVRKN